MTKLAKEQEAALVESHLQRKRSEAVIRTLLREETLRLIEGGFTGTDVELASKAAKRVQFRAGLDGLVSRECQQALELLERQ